MTTETAKAISARDALMTVRQLEREISEIRSRIEANAAGIAKLQNAAEANAAGIAKLQNAVAEQRTRQSATPAWRWRNPAIRKAHGFRAVPLMLLGVDPDA